MGGGVKGVLYKRKRGKKEKGTPFLLVSRESKRKGAMWSEKKRGRKSKQGFCGKRGKGDRVGEEKASSTELTALARGTRTK